MPDLDRIRAGAKPCDLVRAGLARHGNIRMGEHMQVAAPLGFGIGLGSLRSPGYPIGQPPAEVAMIRWIIASTWVRAPLES